MTTDTRIATTSAVDPQITGAMAVFDRLAPLKSALGIDKLTEPELQLFAMVAYQTGLDPFTKQIYAIKRGGKVTHQTGIDGYRTVAESKTGQYAGSDEATYEECTCGEKDSPVQHPAVARVTVHRILPGGHVVDQVGVARWHELKPNHTKRDYGYDDDMWWRMPFNQLAKCAEANGLRKAFPRVLGGIYIEEEMQQAGPGENPALVAAAAQPTARERMAARREAVEQTDPVVVIEAGRAETAVDPVTVENSQTPAEALSCGDVAGDGISAGEVCGRMAGHPGVHKNSAASASWPRTAAEAK
jgi:phage recombination protein Bet